MSACWYSAPSAPLISAMFANVKMLLSPLTGLLVTVIVPLGSRTAWSIACADLGALLGNNSMVAIAAKSTTEIKA